MALLALAALILGSAVVPRVAVFLLRHRSIVVGRTLIPTCSRAGRPPQRANRLHASEVRTYLVRVACAVSLVVFSRIAFQILPPLLCLLATLGAACMGVALLCDLVARIIPWEVSAALLVLGAVFVLAQTGGVLPLELLALAGALVGGAAVMNWGARRLGKPQPLGSGDVRLLPALCLFSGFQGSFAGMFACSLAMGAAAIVILLRRKAIDAHVPMMPGFVVWYCVGLFC